MLEQVLGVLLKAESVECKVLQRSEGANFGSGSHFHGATQDASEHWVRRSEIPPINTALDKGIRDLSKWPGRDVLQSRPNW